eukprot:326488-Prorocentrum_minimum.AAC.3
MPLRIMTSPYDSNVLRIQRAAKVTKKSEAAASKKKRQEEKEKDDEIIPVRLSIPVVTIRDATLFTSPET